MKKEKTIDELTEIFRINEIGLYDICRWWIAIYPEDIFVTKNEITQIRNLMKQILKKGLRK